MQTTTTLAAELNTTPRTLRKFLRSDASGVEAVGKGSRYSLPTAKREVASLKKKFDAWGAAQAEAKAKREAEAEAPAEVEVEAPEADTEGPTDEEMQSIIDGTHPDFA